MKMYAWLSSAICYIYVLGYYHVGMLYLWQLSKLLVLWVLIAFLTQSNAHHKILRDLKSLIVSLVHNGDYPYNEKN